MNRESCRLDSFHSWTYSEIDTKLLARYGFYYIGFRDIVQCAFCRIQISDWLPEDDIVKRHRLFSNNCCLISKCPNTTNIPIDGFAAFEELLPTLFIGHRCIEVCKGSYSESDFPNINRI